MPMTCYSSAQFLDEYELKLKKEFEYDDRTAEWAPNHGGPRSWGQEDEVIELGGENHAAAVSSDLRYLAVSSDKLIQIYDLESLALCSELEGHEDNVAKLDFVAPKSSKSAYTLISCGAKDGGRGTVIHTWSLTAEGKQSLDQRAMPFAVEHMADNAIASIKPDLETHHDLTTDEIASIRTAFLENLKKADAQNRIKHIPTTKGGFPGFGSVPISHDQKKMLTIVHAETTQHGMRPADELPQIAVIDIVTQKETARLKGHEDAMMWAAWSPDDRTIASACWDSTYRLWDAETGECRHTIGPAKGQNWSGGFLPDGKHVLLSGSYPAKVAIYEVETAKEVACLKAPEGQKLDGWMRYFKIHPTENLVILQNGNGMLAWRPFAKSEEEESVQEILDLGGNEEGIKKRYANVFPRKWVDGGKKLMAQGSDQTTYVWDVEAAVKWRFQRPKGTKVEYGTDVFFVERKGGSWIVCTDGDGKVRFWKL